MNRIRAGLIGVGLLVGMVLNLFFAPQLMTPRPPVFNGPDIAENWEWRSMAIQMHSWWLWNEFPNARVTNVGFVPPVGNPQGLPVGMQFSLWIDELLGLDVDKSLPPLDVSELEITDALSAFQKVYSRIHCRTGQEMAIRDTCYYFVAWDDELLTDDAPVFIGIETNRTQDKEEMALVEKSLLEKVSPVPLSQLKSIDEVLE